MDKRDQIEEQSCGEGCGGCVARRRVLRWAGAVSLGAYVGVGCVNVRRHMYTSSPSGPKGAWVPLTQLAKLRTFSDVMELRVKGVEGPIFVRRLASGELLALSSVCTHRDCELESAPYSYDCPCHGSRFDLQGKVLAGPAVKPLLRYPITKTAKGLWIALPA